MTTSLKADRPSHSFRQDQTNERQISEEQQKIVDALTSDEFFWRSRKRLLEVTGLAPSVLDHSLAQLIHHQLVKPAFGKHSIVFGLRARVERKQEL